VIGQHVTGTNDHETDPKCDTRTAGLLLDCVAKRKGKSGCFKLFQTADKSTAGPRSDPSAPVSGRSLGQPFDGFALLSVRFERSHNPW
jgi:hypothetical protein